MLKIEGTPEEVNLFKLSRTSMPMNFVKKHHGVWNHEQWLEFLDYIKSKNYFPIDTDQVGLLLEAKKAKYLETAVI